MRAGNRFTRVVRRGPVGSERGFAYVGVLVLTAVIGIGLMQAGLVWSKQRQRERETELLFVGGQIRTDACSVACLLRKIDGSRCCRARAP